MTDVKKKSSGDNGMTYLLMFVVWEWAVTDGQRLAMTLWIVCFWIAPFWWKNVGMDTQTVLFSCVPPASFWVVNTLDDGLERSVSTFKAFFFSVCVRVCSGFWPIDVSCNTPALTPGILAPSPELTCQTLQRLLSGCLYILEIWIAL